MVSGMPKPKVTDQPNLIASVDKIVKRMVPPFNHADIKWVRALKTGKGGVFNVECCNVAVATAVKSAFANLVKSDSPPTYLKNVSIVCRCFSFRRQLYFRIYFYLA